MNQLPEDPTKEKVVNVLSIISSAAPYLGGPVSAILSGYVTNRKFERIAEVINGLAEGLKNYKNEASERFVATDDFEDLLDDTLRKAAHERNEQKRQIFKNMLLKTIRDCDSNFDQLQIILRIIEQLQPDHIILLKALDQETEPETFIPGSPMETIQRRIIINFSTEHITDLVDQLDNLRVIKLLSSLNTMMTGTGAQNLRQSVTPLGRKILSYIKNNP